MQREIGRANAWRSWLLVSALGAATATGVGLGISESPAFTSAPDPIGADCLPSQNAVLPVQDEANNLDQVAGIVQTMHFFVSATERDDGISVFDPPYTRLINGLADIRRNVPQGKPYTKTQDKEADTLYVDYYQAEDVESKQYLHARGITVQAASPAALKVLEHDTNETQFGTNGYLVATLSNVPVGIITASGIHKVIFGTKSPNEAYRYYGAPKVMGSTLLMGGPPEGISQSSYGLAEMVLNNCPDKQAILNMMEALSANGGYKTGSPVSDDTFSQEKSYYTTFVNAQAASSPEAEFIELFSQAIQGLNLYKKTDLATALGQKRQFVQAIFNKFVPHGTAYEEFGDDMSNYINNSFGGPIQYWAKALPGYIRLLNNVSDAEKQTIQEEWDDGESLSTIEQSLTPSSN